MKKYILLAILLLLISTLSFAQTASVTATVNTALSISSGSTLALGNVVKGSSKTILSSAAGAAAFTVTGELNTPIAVTVTFPSNLSDGTNNLSFTGQIPIYNTTNTQTGATGFGALTGGSATTSGTGNLYLWMGGGVTATAGQVSGLYSGTITVAVAYP